MGESVVLMLGTGLESRGGITAVARSYEAAGLFDRVGIRYVSTYEAPGLRTQLVVVLRALRNVLPQLFAGRVRLVHAHSASRGSFWRKSVFCALGSWFRVPYVFHIHSGEFPDFYMNECGPIARAWVRWTLRRASTVIALSTHWKDALLRIEPLARIVVLGNPVAVSASALEHKIAHQVLFLGRLRERKGVFDLVRAMPTVVAQVAGVRFVLAGDGDIAAVEALARELGVANALTLPGWVEGREKSELLAQADVFVLPSHFEGLPVCILEAMAADAAVVACRVGGIPDLIVDSQTGLLVEAGSVDALANALILLLKDSALKMRLREAAKQRVKARFEQGAVARQLLEIYANFARDGRAVAARESREP